MTDPNDGDRPEIISAPDLNRPTSERDDPDHVVPRSAAKTPATRRRAVLGAAAVLVVGGAAATVVVVNQSSAKDHGPSPQASSSAPKPKPPSLPLSAVHDAHGLIVTLPDIRRILGPTPLPGVTLSENQVTTGRLGNIVVTDEICNGFVTSASQYRALDVRLTKFPSTKQIRHTFGKTGPGPIRKDAHHWIGPATPIPGLGGPGIVYQYSNGPYEASIPGKDTKFDRIAPTVQARYRNVVIEISFTSADFTKTKNGKVKVAYPTYSTSRDEVVAITRKLVAHL